MKQLHQIIFLNVILICSLCFQAASIKNLGGMHLKFTGYNNPPYDNLERKSDGNYTISGSNAEFIEWLSKKTNFTYSVEEPVTDPVLIAKFGFYDLAINKLGKNGFDGIIAVLAVNLDRAERADFTSMAWTEPYTIVAPKPEHESRLFAFIRPFQPIVWLYLLVSSIVIIAIMSWFFFYYEHQFIKTAVKNNPSDNKSRNRLSKAEIFTYTTGYYIVYVVNILTNHGIYSPYAQQSFRILAAGWLLAALVLVNSYSSIIVSSLTVPTMKPPVNTLEDLANNKDVSIILSIDVVLSKTILNATSGIFKTLGDQARENPNDRIHSNTPSLMKKLADGHFGYPFIESFNRNFIAQQYKADGQCRFQMSPSLQLSSSYFNILVRKNFPYTSTLNWGLSYLWETGLPRHWVYNVIPKAEKCFGPKKQQNSASIQKVATIKLEDLVSAFLILGIGIGLGILTFLVELIIKH